VSVVVYGVAAWLFLVGLYGVVSSRNMVHLVVCLTVTQSSTYVLLLSTGYRNGGTIPIFSDIPRKGARTVDPVVHALVLTDIVVAVTVAALLLALVVQAHRRTGTLDPDGVRALKG
jgi:multicomponent Na+:H+ antiporter subunit C